MAAHRYWRIASLRNDYTFNTAFAEVALRTADNTNRVGSGTASATSFVAAGYEASKAADGNTGTIWFSASSDAANGLWSYDFGAGNAWDIASLIITASSGGSTEYQSTPTQFGVLYSDDGTTWTDACAAISTTSWTAGLARTFTVGAAIGTAWRSDDTKSANLGTNNLTVTAWTTSNMPGARSLYRSAGKYYFETTLTTAANAGTGVGIANASATFAQLASNAGNGLMCFKGFAPYFNFAASGALAPFGTVPQGTTVGFALDLTSTLLWMKQWPSGNWNGSGTANPATGTGGFNYGAIGTSVAPVAVMPAVGDATTLNVGGSAFAGTAPSGFTAWQIPAAAPAGGAQAMVMIFA